MQSRFKVHTPGFFLTDIEKTQGKNNSPNSITQGNFLSKTQRTGSIFWLAQKNLKPVLIGKTYYTTNKRQSLKMHEAQQKLWFNLNFSLFFHNFQITARFAEKTQGIWEKLKGLG